MRGPPHYYVGLLSAAALHGAAHQQPQEFQIVTDKQLRPTGAGRSRLRFFLKRDAGRTRTEERRTDTGMMRLSTPESTAYDLVRYSTALGGLSAVATVLAELADKLEPNHLVREASEVELAVIQRTGYLLDHVGATDKTDALGAWLAARRPRRALLRADVGRGPEEADKRWAIIPNEAIEVDE